ncbi:MAG: MarR family transcriptional regulator [Xanthomonadales bacterium]|jgi:DNA-binding MarR family transcriptional regulator|nr:MarR family transcriptional regulator [Xanthomonadales bacterium]
MPAAKSKRPAQTCAAGTPDPLHLDQQLCFALYAASNRIQRLYRPLLEPLGLTYPQYLVMLVLWQYGRRSVSELGEALHLDSGTLTPLLKRLEAAGLVQRQRCSEDERRVYVEPTAEGRGLRMRAVGLPERMGCATRLEPAALLQLRDEVRNLLASLATL